MSDLYVALLHHPVYDKNHQVVTTSVTNIDVHDIARSSRTFGVKGFFVVTPVDALRGLVRKIMRHWQEGVGAAYNENRKEALDLVSITSALEDAEMDIEVAEGRMPVLVATSARPLPGAISYAEFRRELESVPADGESPAPPYLLLLGTGWGLADEVVERCERRLLPLDGPGDYNHLSVRAAAAVILDRLRGTS